MEDVLFWYISFMNIYWEASKSYFNSHVRGVHSVDLLVTSVFAERACEFCIVGHALRMANPSPLTILLRFLQPGLRRSRGHARTLTLHQNIIDDISAINQSVKSTTSASSSYFSRIVATLSTNWAFNIYIVGWQVDETCYSWSQMHCVI